MPFLPCVNQSVNQMDWLCTFVASDIPLLWIRWKIEKLSWYSFDTWISFANIAFIAFSKAKLILSGSKWKMMTLETWSELVHFMSLNSSFSSSQFVVKCKLFKSWPSSNSNKTTNIDTFLQYFSKPNAMDKIEQILWHFKQGHLFVHVSNNLEKMLRLS